MAKAKKSRRASRSGSDNENHSTTSPAPALGSGASGLSGYLAFAALGGVVAIIVAALLIWWQVVNTGNDNHERALVSARVAAYQSYFDGRYETLKAEVARLSSAPSTRSVLLNDNPESLNAAGEQLRSVVPYALRVDIIPKGQAQVDLNANTSISFAALAAIKRAESSPFVGPEVSLNQHQMFYVAAPVTNQGVVTGTIFVAYSTNYFFDSLNKINPAWGVLRVKQQFSGESAATVMQYGEDGRGLDPVPAKLSIPNWSLEFSPNPNATPTIASLTALITPFAVAIALALAAIYLSFTRLFRKIEDDASLLTEFAARAIRGRSPRLERYSLPLFQNMSRELSRHVKGGAAKPEVPDKEPVVDGYDDIADDEEEAKRLAAKKPIKHVTPEEDFLDVTQDDNFGIEVTEDVGPLAMGLALDTSIFRAYDIRGLVKTNLTEEVVYWLGRAFAAEAAAHNQTRVAVGRDGRLSSEDLKNSLCRGLNEGGLDVVDVGQVPTPLLYYANHALDTGTGIMITGSHNPPEYNGLKMVIAGVTLAEDRIQGLLHRLENNDLTEGSGDVEEVELVDHYIDKILDDVAVAQPKKVVIDCGNGVAGAIAPRLLEELGCEVVPLYCEVDGTFPNHHPDPADPANLQDLIAVVKDENADIGLAFDGDGDRLGVVSNSGEIIWPDKLLMLFARDIVGRNPGADIIYDVKCSRHLNNIISEYGGRPIMWRTGHSHMKAKIKETGALLAGEFSGHICFAERWYGFDDALYSAARLMEILGSETENVDELFSAFPVTFTTPEIKIKTTDEEKFTIMEKLAAIGEFDGTITDIDGIRVDFADGWGLVRPSNTSPMLTLRFEADGQGALDRIKKLFQDQLHRVDPALTFDG